MSIGVAHIITHKCLFPGAKSWRGYKGRGSLDFKNLEIKNYRK